MNFMSRSSQLILPALMLLGLTACSSPQKNVAYLISHPDKLKKVLKSCDRMGSDRAASDNECQQAGVAVTQIRYYYPQLQKNPEAFGQQIMAAQSQLVQLKQQLQQAGSDGQTIKQKISQLQEKLRYMLAITVAAGE